MALSSTDAASSEGAVYSGRVTSIDPAQHEIVVKDQQQTQQLKYDYLVYALESMTDRQSVPGVAEYAYTSL
jgi:NADH dehydrogenase FAD-containing subunit